MTKPLDNPTPREKRGQGPPLGSRNAAKAEEDKVKKKAVGTRVTFDVVAAIEECAARAGRSFSAEIEQALIDRYAPKPSKRKR